MADFESMRDRHREDSVKSLTFFIAILTILFFEKQYTSLIESLINKPSETYDLASLGFVIFLTIGIPLGSYFIFLASIARQDFYYTIDNIFFKKRSQVNLHICLNLIKFETLSDEDSKIIKSINERVIINGEDKKLMNIFYKYIEKPDVVNPELKNQAFIYWGDYFSSISFIFFGIIFLIIYSAMAVLDFSIFKVITIACILGLLIVAYHNISKGKVSKKLYEIPEEQIDQIHQNANMALLNDLRSYTK